jgi:hypothetical protein
MISHEEKMKADQKEALENYFNSLKMLKRAGIVKNNKDFTSQLGEWLASEIYGGKLAESGIQKYWDFEAEREYYQVKTHAKAETTTARWSSIKNDPACTAHYVIIIVFNHEYKLKEFYNIPWGECRKNIFHDSVTWNRIKEFLIPLKNLPRQEIVEFFLEKS